MKQIVQLYRGQHRDPHIPNVEYEIWHDTEWSDINKARRLFPHERFRLVTVS